MIRDIYFNEGCILYSQQRGDDSKELFEVRIEVTLQISSQLYHQAIDIGVIHTSVHTYTLTCVCICVHAHIMYMHELTHMHRYIRTYSSNASYARFCWTCRCFLSVSTISFCTMSNIKSSVTLHTYLMMY